MSSRWDQLLEQIIGPEPGPAIAIPPGHAPYVGQEAQDTEGTQSFTVPNGTPLDQRTSFVVGSCIVDNNTSAWINIPDATKDGTGRFVGPGQGASFPILGHISRARVNWLAPPGKVQPAIVATEQAQVIFLAAAVPPGFGFAAPVPSLRWNIFAAPATGSQASAVRAATPGVTHIADSAIWSCAAPAAPGAAVESSFSILDGASTLHTGVVSLQNIAGDREKIPIGPGLNQRGTPGNSMTVQWAGGMTGTDQRVSLSGYDQ